MTDDVPRVLFVCMHNAGRSQIAETLFNVYAGGHAVASSAGLDPVKAVSITVVASMRMAGYDLTHAVPKALTEALVDEADRVITIGLAAEQDSPPEIADDDWEIDDPAGAPMARVAEIRDEIARRVRALLREMGIEPIR
jgi:protein-tyrosine-phosphatase